MVVSVIGVGAPAPGSRHETLGDHVPDLPLGCPVSCPELANIHDRHLSTNNMSNHCDGIKAEQRPSVEQQTGGR